MFSKIVKIIKHNSAVTIAVLICVTALGLHGCVSTTDSILQQGKKVTRGQLQLEFDQEIARLTLAAKEGIKDLNLQDSIKDKLFEIGVIAASGGTVSPLGVATSIIGLLGIGAIIDNRKKDGVISTLKKT